MNLSNKLALGVGILLALVLTGSICYSLGRCKERMMWEDFYRTREAIKEMPANNQTRCEVYEI
jgi:hypothetical protein